MSDTKAKISQFEKVQNCQEDDFEKKRQRAKFDSKLSKFQGNGDTLQHNGPSEVKNKAKYFADIPAAEARLKEAQVRKASFDQVKLGFERHCSVSEKEQSKLQSTLEIFTHDPTKEEEEERRREEEARRKEEFQEKSKAFQN